MLEKQTSVEDRPTFLIVGAAKSGTTTLFDILRRHPQVVMPSRKETGFFSGIAKRHFVGPGARTVRRSAVESWEEYRAIFRSECRYRRPRAIGEASTDYLIYHREAARAIVGLLGADTKIVIILRNPVEAAYSRYVHNCRRGWEDLTFSEALSAERERRCEGWLWDFWYVEGFRYAAQVRTYLDIFANVHICHFRDLVMTPQECLLKIGEFLGLEEGTMAEVGSLHLNRGGFSRLPRVSRLLDTGHPAKAFLRRRAPNGVKRAWRAARYQIEGLLRKPSPAMEPNDRARLECEFRSDIMELRRLVPFDTAEWL